MTFINNTLLIIIVARFDVLISLFKCAIQRAIRVGPYLQIMRR